MLLLRLLLQRPPIQKLLLLLQVLLIVFAFPNLNTGSGLKHNVKCYLTRSSGPLFKGELYLISFTVNATFHLVCCPLRSTHDTLLYKYQQYLTIYNDTCHLKILNVTLSPNLFL